MNLQQKYQAAVEFHGSGDLAAAERLYLQILEVEPRGFFPNHMLGVIRYQQGRVAEAQRLIATALETSPREPVALLNYGLVLEAMGQFEEALVRYDRALELRRDYAEAYFSRANALQALGRLDEALANYDKALALKPDYADAYNNRGATLHHLKRFEAALESCRKAVALNTRHAAAHCNCGNALTALSLFEDALASYEQAIALKPDHADAFLYRGAVLHSLQRFPEALASYDKAIALRPAYADAWRSRGVILHSLKRFEDAVASCGTAIALNPDLPDSHIDRSHSLLELGRFEEALESCERAIQLEPDYAEAYNNRGSALAGLFRPEEALASYNKAIALLPDFAEAYSSRGVTLQGLMRFDEAAADFETAMTLKPDFAQAHFNAAMLDLLLGRWRRGWENYEWRKKTPQEHGHRNLPAPVLASPGQAAGKTVLVHAEQGLGDTIQFFRYLEMLHAVGAKVLFAPQRQLARLLETAGAPVEMVDLRDRSLSFDYQIALMSLPRLFGTTPDGVPCKSPYLSADRGRVHKWQDRLGANGFKIGIGWQGGSRYRNNASRSFAPAYFRPLCDLPDVRLVSLQKGEGETGLQNFPAGLAIEVLEDFDTGPDAFIDTAAVMTCLDLVITSDTSIAHLAGALGVPVWVALQNVPDWRWLLDRSDSPWYPTMTLFRQPSRGDWASVFSGIYGRLRQHMA